MAIAEHAPLGVQGWIEWEQFDPAGRLVDSGRSDNLFLNMGRSAYAGLLTWTGVTTATVTSLQPKWFHFGTGSATPAATDTALQFFVTAISATGMTAEGNFTARQSTTLNTTQQTGLLTEALLATDAATPTTAMARATFSANHLSGNTMAFTWREFIQA